MIIYLAMFKYILGNVFRKIKYNFIIILGLKARNNIRIVELNSSNEAEKEHVSIAYNNSRVLNEILSYIKIAIFDIDSNLSLKMWNTSIQINLRAALVFIFVL